MYSPFIDGTCNGRSYMLGELPHKTIDSFPDPQSRKWLWLNSSSTHCPPATEWLARTGVEETVSNGGLCSLRHPRLPPTAFDDPEVVNN